MALELIETVNGIMYYFDHKNRVCAAGCINDRTMIEAVIPDIVNVTFIEPVFAGYSGEYKVTRVLPDFAMACAVEIITLPATITSFHGDCFSSATSLKTIYYQGTEAQWNSIEGIETAGIAASVTVQFKKSAAIALRLLADEIRELSGTTNAKGIDDMTFDINDANSKVNMQANLIAQILSALEGRAIGGETLTTCPVSFLSEDGDLTQSGAVLYYLTLENGIIKPKIMTAWGHYEDIGTLDIEAIVGSYCVLISIVTTTTSSYGFTGDNLSYKWAFSQRLTSEENLNIICYRVVSGETSLSCFPIESIDL